VKALLAALAATAVLVATTSTAAADERQLRWGSPGGMVVSPDGRNVYAAGVRTVTFSRDPESGALTELDSHAPTGVALAISPRGDWVYIGADGRYGGQGVAVAERDAASGLLTHVYTYKGGQGAPLIGRVTDVVMSADGGQLYVAQGKDDAILVLRIDQATGQLAFEQALFGGPGGVETLGRPYDIELSPDGRFLYAVDGSVSAFARDSESGRLTPAGQWASNAYRLALAPDGTRLYAGEVDYKVFDRDPVSGALTLKSGAGRPADCDDCYAGGPLTVSPDSGSVFNGEALGNRLFQSAAGPDGVTPTHTYADGADGFQGMADVQGLAWSPDGASLYVATEEHYSRGFSGSGDLSGTVLDLAWDGALLRQVQAVDPTWAFPAYASGEQPGVTIDDAAIYTNDPDVELKILPSATAQTSVRISNDPSFASSELRRIEGSSRYPWRLDTSGPPERTVRHVYARFTDSGVTLSDDIILDLVAPQVLSARLARSHRRSRMIVRARDNRSGVRRLQMASNRSHPSASRPFARTVKLHGAPRRLWVRVIDGAGNASHWRRATR
jgi:6-phosphogluconolactonase (cycloisomerase 2 family)